MVLQLISATPSPYARKVRIQLLEKGIPFELKTEVPWDHTTETPQYNPLEKLPVLIFDDGRDPIYESHYIVEYIEQKFAPIRSLTPSDTDTALKARQLEVLADSICDAGVLSYFEQERGDDKKSDAWLARQARKIEGGLKALNEHISSRRRPTSDETDKATVLYALGPGEGELSTADIAIVSMIDFLRLNQHPALKQYEALQEYADRLNERTSFKETLPYMFEIKDQIV